MPSPICPGPMPRREFLRVGTLALGGLTLPELLARRAAAGTQSRDTAVILFWMWGGPSQLETFDMKPEAPSEYRGPLSPIRTNVPGIEICSYLPLLAQRADRFSLIRSLHHEMSAHNDGSIEVLTGKTPRVPDLTSQAHSEHPDFGMVAARLRGPRPDGLPQYVGVQRAPFMTNPAYLGVAHRSFDTGDPSRPGFSPPNLTLVTGVDNRRLDDRRSLIGQFDRFRRSADASGTMEGIDDVSRARVPVAHQPVRRESLRPEPRAGGHPRSLRPASLGSELSFGASSGRGGGRRHQHRRDGHLRHEQEFQLGRPRGRVPPRLRAARTSAADGPGALGPVGRSRRTQL